MCASVCVHVCVWVSMMLSMLPLPAGFIVAQQAVFRHMVSRVDIAHTYTHTHPQTHTQVEM